MTKGLVLLVKILSGFIFVVALVEAVKLAVEGVKWLISRMRVLRKNLKEARKKRKEETQRFSPGS